MYSDDLHVVFLGIGIFSCQLTKIRWWTQDYFHQPSVLPLMYLKQKDIILWVLPWTINLCRFCFFSVLQKYFISTKLWKFTVYLWSFPDGSRVFREMTVQVGDILTANMFVWP